MKVILLTGGQGTRLSEKTMQIPKPMVEIGGKPILWHIMRHYENYGFKEFVLALGHLQEVIKDYFLNYYSLSHNLFVDLNKGSYQAYDGQVPEWKIHLIDTGIQTQTGGRLRRLKDWIGNETFMLTYGDGLCDVNIQDLLTFHHAHGKLATVTAVHPPPRFGGMTLENDEVISFSEKPQSGWINGGFFVLEPEVIQYIHGDEVMWEKEPLENLAKDHQLMAFRHEGFWQPMDTLRDLRILENHFAKGDMNWLKHGHIITSRTL